MQPPFTPEELAKIREQERNFIADRFLLANKVYAEQNLALKLNAINNVREYGTLSIRTLFLLHGGAILALLSFVAALLSKGEERQILIAISIAHKLRPAFYCFSSGICMTGVIAGIAYFNWGAVFQTYQTGTHLHQLILDGKTSEIKNKAQSIAAWTTYVAISVALVSLTLFAVGSFIVADALYVIGA